MNSPRARQRIAIRRATIPTATAVLLERLQRVARFLEDMADRGAGPFAAARAHASTVRHAVARLEDLADVVEDLSVPPRAARGAAGGRP